MAGNTTDADIISEVHDAESNTTTVTFSGGRYDTWSVIDPVKEASAEVMRGGRSASGKATSQQDESSFDFAHTDLYIPTGTPSKRAVSLSSINSVASLELTHFACKHCSPWFLAAQWNARYNKLTVTTSHIARALSQRNDRSWQWQLSQLPLAAAIRRQPLPESKYLS
jgi:hypothetical protein